MTLSFRARLLLTYGVVVAFAFALVCGLIASRERRWLLDHEVAALERTARLTSWRLPPSADWDRAADRLGAELGDRVTLIDSTGRVIGDSEVPRADLERVENHASRPEVQAALRGSTGSASRASRTVGRELLYVAIPVRRGPVAVLRISESLQTLAAMNASLVRVTLVAALLALLLTVPLLLWVTSWQAARVSRLARAADRFGAGDRSSRADESSRDEIGRLGAALNDMSARLEERMAGMARERDETRQILARMTDGVALLDPNGRVARANQSLARMLGAVPPQPGASFREFARSPELNDLVGEAVASPQTLERDVRLWTPKPRLVRATATPLERDDGVAVLLVLHDLTEREEVHRMRQDFVANVSHELRTPLTSVLGYAETLLDGGLEDLDHREEFVRVIRDQTARLQVLVEDLLSLAELERPRAALKIERFDLRALVERQMSIAGERARRAGLTLDLEPGDGVPVDADRARIEQVIANLIDNAVKYTERGGIRVSLGGDADHAGGGVRDSGPGIPAEDLQRVFERFYRVDKVRSRDLGGTGLGLSIVKHIVTLHGGDVSIDSRIGHGSTFRFQLPRRRPGDSAPAV